MEWKNNHQDSSTSETFSELFQAAQFMKDFTQPWFVCGGWALDLFINRVLREHKDVDFGIWRRDQLGLAAYLRARGWTLEKAAGGQLLPWAPNEFLTLPLHVIRCKHAAARPDFIEILFNEVNDTHFLFRRDPSVRRLLTRAVITSQSGLPMLAPEIALLYKAKRPLQKGNSHDFQAALPHLDAERRQWLKNALAIIHPKHDWLDQL